MQYLFRRECLKCKKGLLKTRETFLYSNVKFMLPAQSSSKFVMAGLFHMGQLCQLKRDGDMKLAEGYTHCQGKVYLTGISMLVLANLMRRLKYDEKKIF